MPFVLAATGPGNMTHTFRELGQGQAELTYSATAAGNYSLSIRRGLLISST